MVDALGVAGLAGGLRELFSYNRENFMFDREMRQKQEFQILAFRNKQAELWRDDIRDIIGMTEKKMDSYLVIATLQLGMCVGLFCEGRLEPGTPPWLLAFYMLALGGAFMYLLMAVWFAMHASVVANCSSVRLLTQFVRLPVPTWEHLEDLRTYASAYESVDWHHMLRIPFTGKRGSVKHADNPEERDSGQSLETGTAPTPAACASSSSNGLRGDEEPRPHQPPVADPWGLERHGARRDLYELEHKHPALRAHVGLARKASLQYQCFDAFARVAMTFGTNQLLNAVSYYCIGYLAVQDGAVWPAWCIVLLMVSIMTTLVNVDITLSTRERVLAAIFQLLGPTLCAGATTCWVFKRHRFDDKLLYILPAGYAAHSFWLLWILGIIGIERQPNGCVLPTKFRAVLYLDVFGWLNGSHLNDGRNEEEEEDGMEGGQDEREGLLGDTSRTALSSPERSVRFGPSTIAFGDDSPDTSKAPSPRAKESVGTTSPLRTRVPAGIRQEVELKRLPTARAGSKGAPARNQSNLLGTMTDVSKPVINALTLHHTVDDDSVTTPLIEHDGIGTEMPKDPSGASHHAHKATHTVRTAPKHVFDPASYIPPSMGQKTVTDLSEGEDIVSGLETLHPGKLPGKVFRLATIILAVMWALGLLYAVPTVNKIMNTPALSEVFVEESSEGSNGREDLEVPGAMGTDPNGLPMFIPLPQKAVPDLEKGEQIDVEWPTHAGFFPRALSCDDRGGRLVVSDDIGFYSADLMRVTPGGTLEMEERPGRRLRGGKEGREGQEDGPPPLIARFTRVERCAALEGQALKDMSVVCTPGANGEQSHCRVLVLLATGPTLAECRLPRYMNVTKGDVQGAVSNMTVPNHRHRSRNHTWLISHDWLHREIHEERVDAMAVDGSCLSMRRKNGQDMCSFDADNVGCVVVGTSLGRILQLRGDMEEDGRLVPDRTIHSRRSPVTHGSLHVLPSGKILALSRKVSLKKDEEGAHRKVKATALAFDGTEGNLVGEWKLPEGIDWLTLSGGGDSLLALGLLEGRDLKLYRFPVPAELK